MEYSLDRIVCISDTHFYHQRQCDENYRQIGYENLIIEHWCSDVQSNDILIHCGDVIWSRQGSITNILKSLPGYKILIAGNHDLIKPHQWWMNHGFDEVYDSLIIGNIVFTHKPVDRLPNDCIVNIHGHLHNLNNPHHEFEMEAFHRLISLEALNYHPIRLITLLKGE